MPLQGAIVMCFGGDGGPTLAAWTWCLGAIAGCHCWVLLQGAIVACFGGDGVPTLANQGAVAGCRCRVPLQCVMVGGDVRVGRQHGRRCGSGETAWS